MEHTANYQLSQWEKTDRIMMEDFNGDNAKVEAALAALAASGSGTAQALTAATNRLNSRFYSATYTGSGAEYGSKTLTLPRQALFLMVSSYDKDMLFALPAAGLAQYVNYNAASVGGILINMSGGTVTWNSPNCNRANTTYHVFAVLTA